MQTFIALLWVVVALCCAAAGFMLFAAMGADAAPAQGAAAAVACGMAIIPYVLVRAIEGMAGRGTNENPPKI